MTKNIYKQMPQSDIGWFLLTQRVRELLPNGFLIILTTSSILSNNY